VLRREKAFQDNKAKRKIFPANIAGLDRKNAALDLKQDHDCGRQLWSVYDLGYRIRI